MKSKNIIKIGIACFAILGALIVFSLSGSESSGIEHYQGQNIYLKCVKCSAVKEMGKDEYFKIVQEEFNNEERPLECEQCGGDCYRALKCSKCDNVFIRGSVRNDYSDRCPKCGFSENEAGVKNDR